MTRSWVRSSVLIALCSSLACVSMEGMATAQLPGGMQLPSGLPTGGLSKDSLLQQAKGLLGDLTSMKSSGKLAPAQVTQVDELLPKAQSLSDELEKPQIDATRLPQLATNLSDLQKQVTALKGFLK